MKPLAQWWSLSPQKSMTTTIFVLFLLSIFKQSLSFNLDIDHPLTQRGPENSFFGFSVSLYRDRNVSWLLVGAPQANTNQYKVKRGGAVYKCSIDSVNSCQQIPFDQTGPSEFPLAKKTVQEDDKSYQWFGATLHSTAEGPIVSCAPRFVYHSINLQRREPIGTCWISRKSFTGFFEYSPCKKPQSWGFHRQGYCQAGMSAAVTKDGKRLFVGAPGSYYWQGQTFVHDLEEQKNLETGKSGSEDDDTFAGYSMTVGQFSSDYEYDVAVGQPKGNNYTGRVIIFSSKLSRITNIDGELPGAYFGYSLATADVNGDKLDDIIIGAPFYASPDEKDKSFEKGRVYIALQNVHHQFPIKEYVTGSRSKSRFGIALASLGDINKDGFDDIAIGAPYDYRSISSNDNGAVYIYLGSKKGLKQKPSQIIYAEDISDARGLKTFGWSLSGGLDVDNNEYNDLLVGAYESDKTVLLRARSVANVNATVTMNKDSLNLEDRNCTLENGNKTVCATVKVCFSYDGIRVENKLDLSYRTILDASVNRPRMFFVNHGRDDDESERTGMPNEEELSIKLQRGQTWCKSREVYMDDFRDKLSPINITMKYWLSSKSVLDPYSSLTTLTPVINVADSPPQVTKLVSIRKNCGRDGICTPDLELHAHLNVDEYVVGSQKSIEMTVNVVNNGEEAYGALFQMRMPYDVQYKNIKKNSFNSEISCNGAKPDRTGTNDLICELGNPLKSGRKVSFVVLMTPARANSASTPDYIFLMNVTSINPENNSTLANNQAQIGIPLRVEVNVELFGTSQPSVISYNFTTLEDSRKRPNTLEDIGKEITHVYTVQNQGRTTISGAEVTILWPTRDMEGEYLLYLVDQVKVESREQKSYCHTIGLDDMNPWRLRSRNSSRNIRAIRTKNGRYYSGSHMETEVENEEYRALSKSCRGTNCTRILCKIADLRQNETAKFIVRSRFWKGNIGLTNEFQISSEIVVMVTQLPYDVSKSLLKPEVYNIATRVHIIGREREEIPWLLILAAVLVGLLILSCFAFALWKLGFFKRKRPPKARSSDREPLRNSSY